MVKDNFNIKKQKMKRETTKLTRNLGSLLITKLSCKASETMFIAINMRSLCFFNAVKNIQTMKLEGEKKPPYLKQ
jgi:hypothetical protein